MEKTLGTSEIPRLRAPQSGVRYRYSTTNNQRIPQKTKGHGYRRFNLCYWPFGPERRSFGSNLRNCVGERPTIRLNARLKFVMD